MLSPGQKVIVDRCELAQGHVDIHCFQQYRHVPYIHKQSGLCLMVLAKTMLKLSNCYKIVTIDL